jgi:lipoyl(octanoyl) transferase
MLPSMQWHFLVTPPAGGAENMARDEALMRWSARTGHAVFRVYGWSAPTLSLGRNQRARGCYNLEAALERGIGIVRRPTGGRALLHHREITYSATLPCRDPAAAAQAYDFINTVLLDGIGALGAPAAMATGAVSLPPGLRPCFDVPSAHEIAIDDRKLVGSAQWRHDDALLQHGSILIADDQHWIGELMTASVAPVSAAATLLEATGREPTLDEGAAALRDALAARVDGLSGFTETQAVDELMPALVQSYRDDEWTWRR